MAKGIDPNDLSPEQFDAWVQQDQRNNDTLQFDPAAELALLACILRTEPGAYDAAAGLDAEDFSSAERRCVFQLARRVAAAGEPGYVAVHGEAHRLGLLPRIPGLPNLARAKARGDHAKLYAGRITDASVRRGLLRAAENMRMGLAAGDKSGEVVAKLVGDAETQHMRLLAVRDKPEDLKLLAQQQGREVLQGAPREYWGLPCGVAGGTLDRMTGGFVRPSFVVLTAPIGQGKSYLASACCAGIAARNPGEGCPLYVSTEMSKKATAMRVLSMASGVPVDRLLRRTLTDEERARIGAAIHNNGLPSGVKLSFMAGADVEAVVSLARVHARKYGLPMLVIDMPAMLKFGKVSGDYERLTGVSNRLVDLANELNTCVLACVQLRKDRYGAQEQGGRLGLLGSIKGTGAWAEDASFILSLERKEGGVTSLSIVKNRETGILASADLRWDPGGGYQSLEGGGQNVCD